MDTTILTQQNSTEIMTTAVSKSSGLSRTDKIILGKTTKLNKNLKSLQRQLKHLRYEK